jgi:hypothetical protein
MKHLFILLLSSLFLVAFTSTGYSQTTTIKKQGNKTIYLDKNGKETGSATKSGNTTIFRDSNNKIIRTVVNSENATTVRNSSRKKRGGEN